MLLHSLIGIFIGAFMGGLGHCAGMCGGIVIGFNLNKHKDNLLKSKVIGNILYFLGRVSSYMLIGLIVGLIGYNIRYGNVADGVIFIILGILVILTTIIFNFFPKFLNLGSAASLYKLSWYKKLFSYALNSSSKTSFYILGVLNGLLPCGLVYSFAFSSAALAKLNSFGVLNSMLGMFVFGLGTFLPLFIIGVMSGKISTSSYKTLFLRLSMLVMIYIGISNIVMGVNKIQGKQGHHSNHGSHAGSMHQKSQANLNQIEHSNKEHLNKDSSLNKENNPKEEAHIMH